MPKKWRAGLSRWGAGLSRWGAGLSPRGALAPPSAGPRKLFRPGYQPCLHRIPFDISLDLIKLALVSDDAIKELILPEFLPAPSQPAVCDVSRPALHSSHKVWQRNSGSTQRVDMIRHDNEGMQCAETVRTGLLQLFLYDARDLRLPKINRAIPGCVEKTVPDYKRLAGSQVFGLKYAFRRKAAPETPSEEGGLSRSVDVRQAAAIGSHLLWWGNGAIVLKQDGGAEAPRGLKPAPQAQAQPALW